MAIATSKFASVTIHRLCQVMAMALWLSASAVFPALVCGNPADGFAQAALTAACRAVPSWLPRPRLLRLRIA